MRKALMPQLRFLEFRGSEEWANKKFENIADFYKGKGISKADIDPQGKTPCIRYGELYTRYGEVISSVFSKTSTPKAELFLSEKDDVIIPSSGETKWDIATASCVMNEGVAFGGDLNVIRSNENGVFISYYLNGAKRHEISKIAQGDTVVHLYSSQLKLLNLLLPRTKKEQKKIADCLSSIDELITAHTQKHNALKAHKKGLMQQLFPLDRETIPKLRFSKFRDTGKWKEKSIQELLDEKIIISHLDGNHGALYPQVDEFSQDGVPYISANDFISGLINFSKCKHLPMARALQFKKGVAKNGDILFAHNATVGPVAKLITKLQFVILSTTATYFRCDNKNLINDFLKFSLSSPSFVKQYTRVMSQSTRNQVPITTQRKFSLQVPLFPEQQKIANCFTTIDDLITAQAQKIEALKAHKKGLMQQLFPSVD